MGEVARVHCNSTFPADFSFQVLQLNLSRRFKRELQAHLPVVELWSQDGFRQQLHDRFPGHTRCRPHKWRNQAQRIQPKKNRRLCKRKSRKSTQSKQRSGQSNNLKERKAGEGETQRHLRIVSQALAVVTHRLSSTSGTGDKEKPDNIKAQKHEHRLSEWEKVT